MGNFIGHAFPGIILSILAIWWIIQMLRRYYSSRQKGVEFKSSPTFKCSCLCGRINNCEVEGWVKAVLCTLGFIGEIASGFRNGEFVYVSNGQSATIFAAFALTGVVDIMRHYKFQIPEAEGSSYAMLTVCLVIEGVLMNYHVHSDDDIEVVIQQLLVYVIFLNAAAVLAELRYRTSLLAAMSRGCLLLLQGLWFIAIGFILYNPFRKSKWEPKNYTLATMLFTWHVLGALIICILLNSIIARKYKGSVEMQSQVTPYHQLMHDKVESTGLLDKNENKGHTIYIDNDDDFESEPALTATQ